MSTPYQGWLDRGNGDGFVYFTDNSGNLTSVGTISAYLPGKGIANDLDSTRIIQSYADKFSPDPDTGNRDMRVWIDANYSASPVEGVKAPQAVDISDWAFAQYIQAQCPTENVTVASNTLTFDRRAQYMTIRVDGGGASPANDINSIVSVGAQPLDQILLIGDVSAGNDGVLKNTATGANTARTRYNGTDFTLSDANTSLRLMYEDRGGGNQWHEEWRSEVGPNENRGIGQAVPTAPGVDSVAIIPAGGTHTIAPGNTGTAPANTSYETDIFLTGTLTLLANQVITVDVTNAIAQERGIIDGGTSQITLSGNTLTVGTLQVPEEMALSGGWKAEWIYDGSTVEYKILPSFDVANTGIINTAMVANDAITTAKIATAAVTDNEVGSGIDGAKLSSNTVAPASLTLNSRRFTVEVQVSTKSGEDNKVRIGYFNFPWTLESCEYWVQADIGAVDDLVLEIETNTPTVYVTGCQHTFAFGTVAGTTSGTKTATALNTFAALDYVSVVPAKPTANGGLVWATLRCIKT